MCVIIMTEIDDSLSFLKNFEIFIYICMLFMR